MPRIKTTEIELLSPAKNLESGKIAINFGADAVYIGAPKFSARASANNSIKDIEELCKFAHKFHSKVYVAFNTILFENELSEAQKLINNIYNAGADALIIQDLGILEMDIPPIVLHASTQTNNVSIEKIKFLQNAGFERVVLARELSLNQIEEIRKNSEIELEAFVHGALCVSYSGQCYMSHFIGGRSGNRGECAQPCRLQYNLLDKNNQTLQKNKHILSLRDMNRSEFLEQMADAGISSFKIEGRLKDDIYVKNVTSFYRKIIDSILEKRTDFKKSSLGTYYFDFEPDAEKTFNRGYTDYFLNGRKGEISSYSPKSIGKKIGKISISEKNKLKIDSSEIINNGDGLCYFDENKEIIGFRVEKNENGFIFINQNYEIKKGTEIFRNFDHEFVKKLSKLDNCRFIDITLFFNETETGFEIIAETTNKQYKVSEHIEIEKIIAQNQEKAIETLKNQLQKTGGTIFKITEIKINTTKVYFLQTSVINELRRSILEKLYNSLGTNYKIKERKTELREFEYFDKNIDYKSNVSNSLSENFYKKHGVVSIDKAFEINPKADNKILMTTKLCVKYNLGLCSKYQKVSNNSEPAFLELENNLFTLRFDCENCEMKIYSKE